MQESSCRKCLVTNAYYSLSWQRGSESYFRLLSRFSSTLIIWPLTFISCAFFHNVIQDRSLLGVTSIWKVEYGYRNFLLNACTFPRNNVSSPEGMSYLLCRWHISFRLAAVFCKFQAEEITFLSMSRSIPYWKMKAKLFLYARN